MGLQTLSLISAGLQILRSGGRKRKLMKNRFLKGYKFKYFMLFVISILIAWIAYGFVNIRLIFLILLVLIADYALLLLLYIFQLISISIQLNKSNPDLLQKSAGSRRWRGVRILSNFALFDRSLQKGIDKYLRPQVYELRFLILLLVVIFSSIVGFVMFLAYNSNNP